MDDGRQVACYGALPGTAPGQATCWGVMVDRKSVTEDGWADLLVGDFDPHTPVAVSCPRASRSAYVACSQASGDWLTSKCCMGGLLFDCLTV